MKKLSVLMAAMLVVSGSVMAQDEESGAAGAGSSAGTIGGIATGTIVAGAIAAGVLAAVVSNNRSDSPVDCPTGQTLVNGSCQPNKTLQCEGSDPLAGGVCTGTTIVVSGSTTVPVTFTYAPTLK
ncbi:hypothetical protein [Rheinheimera sp. MM224]|uniref:hypothetical protein n=1 Tax=Rheinheimera sp. MM224 TaxID=3019969 RepID=UPI0021F8B02C|nr:hypothetical protein [Rheinheimera sp. MM224]CAI3796545.1 hypothetical protein JAMGFMIE_01594 [Rheinheimera sp. MM224]